MEIWSEYMKVQRMNNAETSNRIKKSFQSNLNCLNEEMFNMKLFLGVSFIECSTWIRMQLDMSAIRVIIQKEYL